MKLDPWCVILAGRESARRGALQPTSGKYQARLGMRVRIDPLTDTLRRAAVISSPDTIRAVIVGRVADWSRSAFGGLSDGNIISQPQDQGTAYEVLRALLALENLLPPATALLFLPSDHVVSDANIMTNSLLSMVEWIGTDPGPVYLLGAEPEGPHDELGYIVPWSDARQVPSSVYDFVERPDARHARKLINAGGLWNTFIFGGTIEAMLDLFMPRFDATIKLLRAALSAAGSHTSSGALAPIYSRLNPMDFSRDVLSRQSDKLKVLRMPSCGWWPLKSPKADTGFYDAHPIMQIVGREADGSLDRDTT